MVAYVQPQSQPQLAASTVAREILGSVRFWIGLALLVTAAACGIVKLSDQRANERLNTLARDYFSNLDQRTGTQISEQISKQVSNKIVAEFKETKIKATIEQVANERAQDLLTNAVWPSLEAFRAGIEQANAQLTKSTNELAQVSKEIRLAQRMAAQVAPAASDAPGLLSLVDRTVVMNGSNYLLTLFFKTDGAKPVGSVDLIAGTYKQTAKILSFGVRAPLQSDPPTMNDTGDASRLTLTVTRMDVPVIVELEFSAPTIVKIVGDALEEELTIPVASDKMQMPLGVKPN
jgi:hypothetical protein